MTVNRFIDITSWCLACFISPLLFQLSELFGHLFFFLLHTFFLLFLDKILFNAQYLNPSFNKNVELVTIVTLMEDKLSRLDELIPQLTANFG